MKRPLFAMGISVFLSTVAALLFGDNFAAAVGVFLLVCGLIGPLIAKEIRSACVLLIICAVAMGNVLLQNILTVHPVKSLAQHSAYLEGLVMEIEYENDSANYLLDARIPLQDGRIMRTKVRLYSFTPLAAQTGEEICGYVSLEETDWTGDYRFHYLSDRELLRGIPVTDPEIRPASESVQHSLGFKLLRLRQILTNTVRDLLLPDDAAMVNALLIGDRSGIREETEFNFRRSGLTHLMAVSGLHLSLLIALFSSFLRMFDIKMRTRALLSLPVIVLFIALAGFTPSVLRAGMMTGLYLIGCCLRRRADSLSSLGFAAIIQCICNPYSALSAGFLLSFSATLGILLLTKPVEAFFMRVLSERMKKIRLIQLIVNSLAVSLAATVMTLPVMLFLFDSFTLIAPLTSLAAIPIATFLIWCAIPMLLFGLIPLLNPFAEFLAFFVSLLSRMLQAAAACFASIPFSIVPVRYDFVKIMAVVFYVGATVLFLIRAPGRIKRTCAMLGAAVFVMTWMTAEIFDRGTIRVVTFENVDAALITSGTRASLIGFPDSSYGGRIIDSYCRDNGIQSIELALNTGGDNEDVLGAVQLFEHLPPERLMMPEDGRYTQALLTFASSSKKAVPSTENVFTLQTLGTSLTVYPCSCGRACKIEIGDASLLKCNENCVIMKTDHLTQGIIRGWKYESLYENGSIKIQTDTDGTTTYIFRSSSQQEEP